MEARLALTPSKEGVPDSVHETTNAAKRMYFNTEHERIVRDMESHVIRERGKRFIDLYDQILPRLGDTELVELMQKIGKTSEYYHEPLKKALRVLEGRKNPVLKKHVARAKQQLQGSFTQASAKNYLASLLNAVDKASLKADYVKNIEYFILIVGDRLTEVPVNFLKKFQEISKYGVEVEKLHPLSRYTDDFGNSAPLLFEIDKTHLLRVEFDETKEKTKIEAGYVSTPRELKDIKTQLEEWGYLIERIDEQTDLIYLEVTKGGKTEGFFYNKKRKKLLDSHNVEIENLVNLI